MKRAIGFRTVCAKLFRVAVRVADRPCCGRLFLVANIVTTSKAPVTSSFFVTSSVAPVTSSFFVTTSKAPVTSSDALVSSSFWSLEERKKEQRLQAMDKEVSATKTRADATNGAPGLTRNKRTLRTEQRASLLEAKEKEKEERSNIVCSWVGVLCLVQCKESKSLFSGRMRESKPLNDQVILAFSYVFVLPS